MAAPTTLEESETVRRLAFLFARLMFPVIFRNHKKTIRKPKKAFWPHTNPTSKIIGHYKTAVVSSESFSVRTDIDSGRHGTYKFVIKPRISINTLLERHTYPVFEGEKVLRTKKVLVSK